MTPSFPLHKSDKKIRSCAFVIGGAWHVLEELPGELRGPTLEELKGIASGKEV